ncbi:hypothetical protein HYW59_01250 [Candidatus Kaiserbacteria bacterium]|nr:hypothetical protein [Candidatus Kaiserbacteria bacterium]
MLGSVRKAVRKLSGENVAVNIKRLTGAWEGFYRIRIRKVRIIFSIDTQARTIFVDVIDFRGSAYR